MAEQQFVGGPFFNWGTNMWSMTQAPAPAAPQPPPGLNAVPTPLPPGSQFQLVTFQTAAPAPAPAPPAPPPPPPPPPPAPPKPKQEPAPAFDPRIVYAAVTTTYTIPQAAPASAPVPAAVAVIPAPAPAPAPAAPKADPPKPEAAKPAETKKEEPKKEEPAKPATCGCSMCTNFFIGGHHCSHAAACACSQCSTQKRHAPPDPPKPAPPPPLPTPPRYTCTHGHGCSHGCSHGHGGHTHFHDTTTTTTLALRNFYIGGGGGGRHGCIEEDDCGSVAGSVARPYSSHRHCTRFTITTSSPSFTCAGCHRHLPSRSTRAKCQTCRTFLCEDCVRISYDSDGDIRKIQAYWRNLRTQNGMDAEGRGDRDVPLDLLQYWAEGMVIGGEGGVPFEGHAHKDWQDVPAGGKDDVGRHYCVGCARILGIGPGDRWRCKGKYLNTDTRCDLVLCGVCRWLVFTANCEFRVGKLRDWNASQKRSG